MNKLEKSLLTFLGELAIFIPFYFVGYKCFEAVFTRPHTYWGNVLLQVVALWCFYGGRDLYVKLVPKLVKWAEKT